VVVVVEALDVVKVLDVVVTPNNVRC
jgi:hypothetical protein